MDAVGLSRGNRQVVFGQLLGMCDHITFPLGMHMHLLKIINVSDFICVWFWFK